MHTRFEEKTCAAMPNFLIIGASRSGTTALYHFLRQHPQIYMCPIKETNFFALEERKPDSTGPNHEMIERLMRRSAIAARISDIATYCALFQGISDETAIGEASPAYLIAPRASERIKHYIPHAKLLAILRDPVERAYSDYLSGVADRRWPLAGFAQIPQAPLEQEDWWPKGKQYQYIGIGFYYTHLKRYFDMFDREQIRIHLYEDFKTDPISVLRDSFHFLGADEAFVPDMSIRHGVTGVPKNRALDTVLRKMRRSPIKTALKPLLPTGLRRCINRLGVSNLVRPPLDPEVRKGWLQVYREDILKLQGLLQRDLSAWLE